MKSLKRLSCLLLFMILALGLMTTASAAAQGTDGSFRITIQGHANGHIYDAYQIFKGDLYQKGEGGYTLSNIEWGKNIDVEKTAEIFQKKDETGAFVPMTAKEVAESLSENSFDSETAKSFAQAIIQCLNNTAPAGTSTDLDGDNGNIYIIEGIPCGYYLVKDRDGSVNGSGTDDFYTRIILEVVGDSIAVVKGDVPTVDKEVLDDNNTSGDNAWGGSADHDVNDVISYKLTAALPDNYHDYKSYKLAFHDRMDAGLSVSESDAEGNRTWNVYIADENGEPILDKNISDKFTWTAAPGGENGFDLTAGELVGTDGLGDNVKIVCVYTATLTDDAKLYYENDVILEYSNNPNVNAAGEPEPGTGTTPPKTAVVFTYNATVNKVQPDPAGDAPNQTKELKGAAFALNKLTIQNDGTSDWTELLDYSIEDIYDSERSSFSFTGLDDGVYRLSETVVPAGFNKCDDIYFEIAATHGYDGEGQPVITLSVYRGEFVEGKYERGEEATDFTITLNSGNVSTDIINQSGLQLPETGGIGTTIFYMAGGVLVAVALILLVTRRRMKSEQ